MKKFRKRLSIKLIKRRGGMAVCGRELEKVKCWKLTFLGTCKIRSKSNIKRMYSSPM